MEDGLKDKKVPILEIKNMSISFTQYAKGLRQVELPVIRDLNVSIHSGELVAVIGSSGSGKSLLAHGVLGILPYNGHMGGEVYYEGELLTEKRIKGLRGSEIVLVPQSVAYLDPLMKVGQQVRKSKKDAANKKRLKDILKRYDLEEKVEELYPFELSGGMARRVLISTALMEHPKLVIADEPTPGLHIEAARETLKNFREIADQGAGVLLITHDLELALEVANRIVVFYAGTTIEEARTEDFKSEETLRHPYTKALWRAMPNNGFGLIDGTQPYVKDMPGGCPFEPRCPIRQAACKGEIPYREVRGGYVKCING